MSKLQPFKTAEQGLAAYLCLKGLTLVGTVSAPTDKYPDRMEFVLTDDPMRPQFVEEWITGSGEAETCKLFNAKLRLIKGMMRDSR